MSYYYAESHFKSDSVVGWYLIKDIIGIDPSVEFTNKINHGLSDGSTKEQFIYETHYKIGGYGLGQWYPPFSLEKLFEYAQEWGDNIADAEMQCNFTIWLFQETYPNIYKKLYTLTDLDIIVQYIASYYDGHTQGAGVMSLKAKEYYGKYSKNN